MVDVKLQLDRQDESRLTQFREELCYLQSGEIREPSKVRTRGSISSHLEEEEKEGGKQEKRRQRGDVLGFF